MSIKTLAARLEYAGGDAYGRIKETKRKSFLAALKNSYNSRPIETHLDEYFRCLINESNQKIDYDKKMISIDFSAGLEPGDVFRCLDDETHWMIYLPRLTETAYLHSEIIRCRYTLNVNGKEYWIYFQGPTETDLRWFQKRGVNINELNLSGTIFIKNDENTRNFFKRFTHIKIEGHIWEVQVTDYITVPGVLELEVQEYYDDYIAELPEVIRQDIPVHQIHGKQTVRQEEVVGYAVSEAFYNPKFIWSILDNPRVKVTNTFNDGRTCEVKVHDGAVGSFTVLYGDTHSQYSLNVNIESEIKTIEGNLTVRPYDIVTYKTDIDGIFWVMTKDVQILSQSGRQCKIEIMTGKQGKFTLYFKDNDTEEVHTLDVEIKSI